MKQPEGPAGNMGSFSTPQVSPRLPTPEVPCPEGDGGWESRVSGGCSALCGQGWLGMGPGEGAEEQLPSVAVRGMPGRPPQQPGPSSGSQPVRGPVLARPSQRRLPAWHRALAARVFIDPFPQAAPGDAGVASPRLELLEDAAGLKITGIAVLPPWRGGGAGGCGGGGGTLPQPERDSLGGDGKGVSEGEGVQGGEGQAAVSHPPVSRPSPWGQFPSRAGVKAGRDPGLAAWKGTSAAVAVAVGSVQQDARWRVTPTYTQGGRTCPALLLNASGGSGRGSDLGPCPMSLVPTTWHQAPPPHLTTA